MRRTLVISEEFGLYRAENHLGQVGTGRSLPIALEGLLVAVGERDDLIAQIKEGFGHVSDVFSVAAPAPPEGRPDVPASTVR